MLTHTLGLGIDVADPDLRRWSAAIGRTANLMDWDLAGITTPLKFAPGEGWYYGTATDWAGQLLERVTGLTIGTYMQQHIFSKLDMTSTGFWPEKLSKADERMAEFTFRDGVALKPGPSPVKKEHPIESAGGGLFSSAADYVKLVQAVLREDVLLRRETSEIMFAPQLDDVQRQMLMLIADYNHDAFAPEFPRGLELSHGFAGVVNLEDVSGKRRKGSLMWSGMPNTRWVSVLLGCCEHLWLPLGSILTFDSGLIASLVLVAS